MPKPDAGDAVALGLWHEGGRSFDIQAFDLFLEVTGHVVEAIDRDATSIHAPHQERWLQARFIRTLKENLLWARPSNRSKSSEPRSSSSPGTTTKPGSSPATVIVPQPRYEPLNASLIERNGRSKLAA